MTRALLVLLVALLASACAGHVETAPAAPCDGYSFIEMATSPQSCDGSAPACSFDASYRQLDFGDECEASRFTCERGVWTGAEAPAHKISQSKRNACGLEDSK